MTRFYKIGSLMPQIILSKKVLEYHYFRMIKYLLENNFADFSTR